MSKKALTFGLVSLVVIILFTLFANGKSEQIDEAKETEPARVQQLNSLECQMGVKSACK